MKDYDGDQFVFSSDTTYTISVDSLGQFTNCLDGLLRDPFGNVIELNPMDYEHQIYCRPCGEVHIPVKRLCKYVFKQGKLYEVPFDFDLNVECVF